MTENEMSKILMKAVKALAEAGWIVLHGDKISAEMDHPAGIAADYYELGYPWVNPELEKALKANGLDFDWMNPGELVIYEAADVVPVQAPIVERKMDPAMIAEMARIESALKEIVF